MTSKDRPYSIPSRRDSVFEQMADRVRESSFNAPGKKRVESRGSSRRPPSSRETPPASTSSLWVEPWNEDWKGQTRFAGEIATASEQRACQTWVEHGGIDPVLPSVTQSKMRAWTSSFSARATTPESRQANPQRSRSHSTLDSPGPRIEPNASTFVILANQIASELQRESHCLLALNPSRRKNLLTHLDYLAGVRRNKGSEDRDLRNWVYGPLTPAQTQGLQAYFEEIALVYLGQVLVLKAWSDKGIRKWRESDLSQINWAIIQSLRPYLPIRAEGWQITRQNLYSWFSPSPKLQKEIFLKLAGWDLRDCRADFLCQMIKNAHQARPDREEFKGFDPRFSQAIWSRIGSFGIDSNGMTDGPIRRKPVVFSPTLRDGYFMRHAPEGLTWYGFELYPFRQLVAELSRMWTGPTAPPTWQVGTGLKAQPREQLQMTWNAPGIQRSIDELTEMESADLSIVLEEETHRLSQAKSSEAATLREDLEGLKGLQEFKSPSTSLGAFQALVSLNKLRPGGIMFWFRNEPLNADEGHPMIRGLLERGKLLCEWDLSSVGDSLPTEHPLFPKFMYLWQRCKNLEEVRNHYPIRILTSGKIRSHVEVPLFLEDQIDAFLTQNSPRGQWSSTRQRSPEQQQDWIEHWPSLNNNSELRKLETLRNQSVQFFQFGAVKSLTRRELGASTSDFSKGGMEVLWLYPDFRGGQRRLKVKTREEILAKRDGDHSARGFLVYVKNRHWRDTLAAYFQSDWVKNWLDHHLERTGGKWILKEPHIKTLPIPTTIVEALERPSISSSGDGATTPELPYEPRKILEGLKKNVAKMPPAAITDLYVQSACTLASFGDQQARLFSVVRKNGSIRWAELLQILPKDEQILFATHPEIRIVGTIPGKLPIDHLERVTEPQLGIKLRTDSGFSVLITAKQPLLLDILWDQMDSIQSGTWQDMVQFIRLPRTCSFAKQMAHDILRSFGDQKRQRDDLMALLKVCEEKML